MKTILPAPSGFEEHSGEIGALMGWFFLRHLGRVYKEFKGDFVMAIVLGEIAHHNICHYFSLGKAIKNGKRHPDGIPPDPNMLEPCNAFSLSEATGIPRETIRRKICHLEKIGLINKHIKGGYVIDTDIAGNFTNINIQTLNDFLETSDELRKILEK